MKNLRSRFFFLCLPAFLLTLPALDGCSRGLGKGSAAGTKKAVTMKRLVGEMADLRNLAEFPDPPYTTRQFSSYDRASKSPTENWFANKDFGEFIRVEDKGDHKEWVMMDADGPGTIVRIWSANPKGSLRFYLNGGETAAFECKMNDLLGGTDPHFPPPIGATASAGWNLYFPIPYSKHLKLTCDSKEFYYQVNYRTYAAGTEVEDFSMKAVDDLKDEISSMTARLESKDSPVPSLKGAGHVALDPGQTVTMFNDHHLWFANEIHNMRIHVEAADMNAALRGIVLLAWFDDEKQPAVRCPLGDFFGTSPGVNAYEALPLGMLQDGTMYSRWTMPFRRRARFEVINKSDAPAKIAFSIEAQKIPGGWNDHTMHFHADYHAEYNMATRPFRDWNYVEAHGKGVFVGDALAIANPVKNWWGEGDEKIYVDKETFPSHFGTGTEDYYGYAWCSSKLFTHPYHNQSRCDGPSNYGYTSVNRFHIFDNIPFNTNFKFDMEVWHQREGVQINYAAVSYWYGLPGATCNLGEPAPADLRVPSIEPLQVFHVENAIEAESLQYTASHGNVGPQDLQPLEGKWSGDKHVWYNGGQPGDTVEFKLDAPSEGDYEIIGHFTKARDFGIAQISVNGKVASEKMDFYSPRIMPTEQVSLGTHHLSKTGNTITFKILGANEKAEKAYMLGVDYFLLQPKASK